MTPKRIDRRKALSLGAAGVGTVVLNACGGSKNPNRAAPPTTTPTATPTSAAPAAASGVAAGRLSVQDFAGAAACTATLAQTEGPYYIDVDKLRGDIREDRPGARLRVAARVVDVDGCTPIKDALFEIWHCDAGGIYSGFEAASRGGSSSQRDASRFLRGAQVTNAEGITEITTIYPGWYRGRTAHIHAKVFVSNTDELTTQLYFDETISAVVYRTAPYSARPGRDTFNTDDSIYRPETTMTVKQDGDGYLGLITIGVRP